MIAFILVLTISCSRTKPEIAFGFIKLILYEGDPDPIERFSFFIIPEDDDGIDNLDELFLYHDREQLRWRIKSDEWIKHTHEGIEWIGTRSLSVRDDYLPRGVFRAVLVNKGGESSERNFTFDGNVRFPFPEIEIEGGIYTVVSAWPVNRLVGHDRSGNYVMTVVLNSLSGNVADLRLSQSVRTVTLWSEDEENFCSAFTNAVLIN
jgi:hypothetical protein